MASTPARWRNDEITHDALVRLMVGRDLKQTLTAPARRPGPVRLGLKELATTAGDDVPFVDHARR